MKRRTRLIIVACLLGMPVLWFVGVQGLVFFEECPSCYYNKRVTRICVLGFPVYCVEQEQRTVAQLVAADLGAPCPHVGYKRLFLQRRWGLCFCAYPCRRDPLTVGGTPTYPYTEQVRKRVKSAAQENPRLGEEFLQKVIREHNWEYWYSFRDRMWVDEAVDTAGNEGQTSD